MALLVLMAASQHLPAAEHGSSGQGAQLTLKGTVLLVDDRPAAGATIRSHNIFDHSIKTVTADDSGRFEIQDDFPFGVRIHAVSTSGQEQGVLRIEDNDVRSQLSKSHVIQLKPALPHRVIVTAEGEPVSDAHLVVRCGSYRISSATGTDGTTIVWYPAQQKLSSIVAWHPTLGVNGARDEEIGSTNTETTLPLRKPKPHVVKLIDVDGSPVAGQLISASVRPTDGEWITTRDIRATRQTTDENGEVRFDWFPAEKLRIVEVQLFNTDWKVDETERAKLAEGLTTVHIRKRYRAQGRVIMPPGVDSDIAGILIEGWGFGPGDNSDVPHVRTRRDGTFSLNVPSEHAYVLGISDTQFASEAWSGEIMTKDGNENEIILQAYRGTPITVRVTRGSARQGVAGASINVTRRGSVEWIDKRTGESRSGSARIGGWFQADDSGVARINVGHGEVEVRLRAGDWSEEQKIEVASGEPANIAFHRDWDGNRILEARPTRNGDEYRPSDDAVALAWTGREPHDAMIGDDGVVRVEFDKEEISVLLLDRKQHVSGYAKVGKDENTIDLLMHPNAVLRGTIVDGNDNRPLVDREVSLRTDSSYLDVVEAQQTDRLGRFEFTEIPAQTPLRLRVGTEPGTPRYILFGGDRLFEPGEKRIDDVASASLMDGHRAVEYKRPARPITERIANTTENTRVMGMRTIVILQGDDSQQVRTVSEKLVDYDLIEAAASYLSVTITAKQSADQSQAVRALNWPLPGDDEIMLIVTPNGKDRTASLRLSCSDIDDAVRQGTEFIERHQPKAHDGRKKLERACIEAKESKRNMWVIGGGRRCGPCFRLARWIDEHRDVLEKDLVIVKLTSGIDEHAREIRHEIGGAEHGIPFHALVSPDGDVLISSDGPLGNIGMPGSIEGIRHFKKMLESAKRNMTSDEIQQLTESLSD